MNSLQYMQKQKDRVLDGGLTAEEWKDSYGEAVDTYGEMLVFQDTLVDTLCMRYGETAAENILLNADKRLESMENSEKNAAMQEFEKEA